MYITFVLVENNVGKIHLQYDNIKAEMYFWQFLAKQRYFLHFRPRVKKIKSWKHNFSDYVLYLMSSHVGERVDLNGQTKESFQKGTLYCTVQAVVVLECM